MWLAPRTNENETTLPGGLSKDVVKLEAFTLPPASIEEAFMGKAIKKGKRWNGRETYKDD